MIKCSLGEVERLKITKALSGYTFAEVALPLDAYADAPTFTIVTETEQEFTITGSEVYPAFDNTQVVLKASAIRKDMEPFTQVWPCSFEEASAEKILNAVGIKGGSKEKYSFASLALTRGQLAILIANGTPRIAFIDFEQRKVLYYDELYKAKAQEVPVKFRRIVSKAPTAGAYLYGNANEGLIPDGAQAMASFGETVGLDGYTMKRFLENYNNLCSLFAGLQTFVWDRDLPLGACVLSPLTMTKCIVCAIEQVWTMEGHTTIYYAV